MALSAVQKVFYDWVHGQVAYPVIWVNPNAPRPDLPYISLHILSMVKMGGDYISKPNSLGIRKIFSDYYINLNISCYFTGDGSNINAFDVLSDLRQSLRTEAVIGLLNTNNISLIKELSSILFIPTIIATGFEQRASIDIQFGIAVSIDETIYIITKVDGKGDVNASGEHIEVDYQSEVI
jgi:hypothetical protein